MRLAHLVCTDAFAGVERYVSTLARVQAAQGWEVTVLGGAHDRMPAELAGTPVTWQPAPDVRTAALTLRRWQGDVVHAHMTAAELAAATSGRPVVSTRHFAGRRGSSLPARVVGSLAARRIRTQVAISDFVALAVEGESVVVHPGVPAQPDGLPAARRGRTVLMAQRLEREKRADLGLRLWAASGLAADGWRLTVAGGGALAAELADLADALGVRSSVDLLGQRADVDDLMAGAGVFLAPRPDEPYGLSVVEAMAHGTPVLAAAGGGHDETVGRTPGAVTFDAADPAAGGRTLAALARDEGRRERYGRALRTHQREHLTVEHHAAALEPIYRGAVR